MASLRTVVKSILGVKEIVTEDVQILPDKNGQAHLKIELRAHKKWQCLCPQCKRKSARYNTKTEDRAWRALDWGGMRVSLHSKAYRVHCPEHGVLVAWMPWADSASHFTREFDYTVAWLAKYIPRSAVSAFMRIDWERVGRCVARAKARLEPDSSVRFNSLVRIGIDETSYKKGYKYITVVVNHDTNTLVWAHPGYGKEVLTTFFNLLSDEQKRSIRVVSGDGARWITDCVREFLPNATRCLDSFHVVQWAMEALDKVRIQAWRQARAAARQAKDKLSKAAGADNTAAQAVKDAFEYASTIKGSAFALGKAPEHLTPLQQIKLERIAASDEKLHRAYRLKEELRLLLKCQTEEQAQDQLHHWTQWASRCRIPEFVELSRKIRRHKTHILDTVREKLSNARVESTNNRIKLIIRKSYGFRNVDNMISMAMLVCSSLKIPLPHHSSWSRFGSIGVQVG